MSRSNPTPTNPAKKFFKWSGSKGQLVYYDKEKQLEVEVKLPFEFLVLDQLSTITGFSKPEKSGYWSNEVRSTVKEELTVKTATGTKYVGLYKNDQGIVQIPKGAKYAKSIYLAFKEGDEFVIGNLKASGSALTAWIELSNRKVVELGKITITGSEVVDGDLGEYHVPTFEWSNATAEEDDAAKKLDKELQIYLSQYLSAAQFDRASQQDGQEESVDVLNEVFPEAERE
jgi:hypothetical protein